MEEELFKFLAKHIKLTEEEKQLFTELNLFKSFRKGDLLLKAGEYAKQTYFVIKGCVRIYYLIDGEEKTTAFFLEEDSMAPESLITGEPSRYFISCEEDSILLIGTPDLEDFVFKKYPKFESLCRILSEKEMAKKQAMFDDFVNSTPEERYDNLLKTRPALLQRVPQYQIASFIGIKPESLSRIRKRKKG